MQQVSDLKELGDVYVPTQLYNRKSSALLDTGCDTSIIGARLLLPGVYIEPTLYTLRAANGSVIPAEGVAKVTFHTGKRQLAHAAICELVVLRYTFVGYQSITSEQELVDD